MHSFSFSFSVSEDGRYIENKQHSKDFATWAGVTVVLGKSTCVTRLQAQLDTNFSHKHHFYLKELFGLRYLAGVFSNDE